MNKWYTYSIIATLLLTGCSKKSSNMWEDQKTSAHYKDKGSALWGESSEESENAIVMEEDFIPLQEEDLKMAFTDGAIPQPLYTPGEEGSSLPSVDEFQSPKRDESAIFATFHFNTDEYSLKDKESLDALDRLATYLKGNPEIFLFVEGHCDERGPEAYNLALGTRRANAIRALLIQKGVDLNRLHTVSYGKERPIALSHDQNAWKQNRRVQFKIYKKI